MGANTNYWQTTRDPGCSLGSDLQGGQRLFWVSCSEQLRRGVHRQSFQHPCKSVIRLARPVLAGQIPSGSYCYGVLKIPSSLYLHPFASEVTLSRASLPIPSVLADPTHRDPALGHFPYKALMHLPLLQQTHILIVFCFPQLCILSSHLNHKVLEDRVRFMQCHPLKETREVSPTQAPITFLFC